jgi:hypothetical protein
MSKLIELLTNPANLKINNKSIKPTQNFILQLLKDSEPKKAVELLKNLHLTNDEIKEIISKLPEKKQKLYFEVLKNIFTQEIKLTQKKDNKIQKNNNLQNNIENLLKLTKQKNDKIQTIDLPQVNDNKDNNRQLTSKDNDENLINNIINLLFNNEKKSPKIKKEINIIKKDLTKLIKKEIESNIKTEDNLITKKVINKIKNADSFEELVSLANKHGLNIKKIITKIIKTETQKPKHLPLSKIPVLKINRNKIISSILKAHKDNNKILQTLINKTSDTNINNKNLNVDNLTIPNNKISSIKNNNDTEKNHNLINNINPNIEIKHKVIQAKESIKHFSNNLKEAIENYKPPISKLSMELHPKELGKVEVTIIHRGDNLQININSNNQAVNFFHTHQTELKNALVNMGYSGIDMNFHSNQNKENQEKKAYKQYSSNKNDDDYDELIIEIPYTYA